MKDLELEIDRLLSAMKSGEPLSPEMEKLVEAALLRLESHKDEDINEWARRLTADIATCTD
jgi:hypothetical protein